MQLTELPLFCAFLSTRNRRVERVDILCRTGAAQLDPSSPRSPGDEGSATTLVVCFTTYFVYRVFAQKPGYAAASPGSAITDGQGYAGTTKTDPASGED